MSVSHGGRLLLSERRRKRNPALEALISTHFVPDQIVRPRKIPLSVFRPDFRQFQEVVSRDTPMWPDRFPWSPRPFPAVHVARTVASARQSRTGIADNDRPRGSRCSIGVGWRGHSCQDLVFAQYPFLSNSRNLLSECQTSSVCALYLPFFV